MLQSMEKEASRGGTEGGAQAGPASNAKANNAQPPAPLLGVRAKGRGGELQAGDACVGKEPPLHSNELGALVAALYTKYVCAVSLLWFVAFVVVVAYFGAAWLVAWCSSGDMAAVERSLCAFLGVLLSTYIALTVGAAWAGGVLMVPLVLFGGELASMEKRHRAYLSAREQLHAFLDEWWGRSAFIACSNRLAR